MIQQCCVLLFDSLHYYLLRGNLVEQIMWSMNKLNIYLCLFKLIFPTFWCVSAVQTNKFFEWIVLYSFFRYSLKKIHVSLKNTVNYSDKTPTRVTTNCHYFISRFRASKNVNIKLLSISFSVEVVNKISLFYLLHAKTMVGQE